MCPPDGQSWQVCHASHGDECVRTHKQHTADKLSHSPQILKLQLWIRIYGLNHIMALMQIWILNIWAQPLETHIAVVDFQR